MKTIIIILTLLISKIAFCDTSNCYITRSTDTNKIIYLEPKFFIKVKDIDAYLLSIQNSMVIDCLIKSDSSDAKSVRIKSFEYTVIRNNHTFIKKRNPSYYFSDSLKNVIRYLQKGDSVVFDKFSTNLDSLKNVKSIPIIITISENSIYHYTKIDSQVFSVINSITELNELRKRTKYSNCFGGNEYFSFPKESEDKSYIRYSYAFSSNYNANENYDYSFEFRYYYKSKKITVFDNLKRKEYSVSKWIETIK